MLSDYFGSPERLAAMTFTEKKTFLHGMFDGKDEDGKPYGIYLTPLRKESGHWIWDYEIHARLLSGGRYLKGADYDYEPGDTGACNLSRSVPVD